MWLTLWLAFFPLAAIAEITHSWPVAYVAMGCVALGAICLKFEL